MPWPRGPQGTAGRDPLGGPVTTFSCADAEPLLPLVADGALRAEDDPALFDHLAACPRCQDSLARHDLVSLALTRTAPLPAARPRIIRHRWWLAVPVAAAAALAVSVALPASPPAPQAAPAVAVKTTIPPAQEPVIIERDVAAIPAGVPGKRMMLVRRGDQVLLVDPAAPAAEVRTDAVPASVRY